MNKYVPFYNAIPKAQAQIPYLTKSGSPSISTMPCLKQP